MRLLAAAVALAFLDPLMSAAQAQTAAPACRPTLARRTGGGPQVAGGLGDHPVTRGRGGAEGVDSVRSFTGEGFRISARANALSSLTPGSRILLPSRAWAFSDSTPVISADGLAQGPVRR